MEMIEKCNLSKTLMPIYTKITNDIEKIYESFEIIKNLNALLQAIKDINKQTALLNDLNTIINSYKDDFEKDEYNRNSSIAQAIYLHFRKILNINDTKSTRREYEHRRWNVWLRFEGYVYNDKISDGKHLAKTHADLKAFDDLSSEEQTKDNI